MASKGKGKVPKIDPALQGSFDSEKALVKQQLSEKEREFFAKFAPETAEVMGVTYPLSGLDDLRVEPDIRDESAGYADPSAPTTLCTSHVGSTDDPWTCRKCGKPFREIAGSIGSTFDSFLEAEGIKDEVDKRAAAALPADVYASVSMAEDDGPLPMVEWLDGPEPDGPEPGTVPAPLTQSPVSKTLVLDPVAVDIKRLWYDRLVTMANADGYDDGAFLEQLIKRQWIASGAGKGK